MSRHQPFGFDSVCTSCCGVAFDSAGDAGRFAGVAPCTTRQIRPLPTGSSISCDLM